MTAESDPAPAGIEPPLREPWTAEPLLTELPAEDDAVAAASVVGTQTGESRNDEVAPRKLSRNRDYQLLMTGRTFSIIGASMTSLAMTLLAYDLTHDAAIAGVVTSMSLVGSIIALLPGGVVVDRHDRKALMLWSSLLAALLLGSIPLAALLHVLTIWQLGIVGLLLGLVTTVYGPSETAALKRVVHPSQLGIAMSVNQARGSFGSIVGPPLAGALYGLGRMWPMAVDALTNVVAAGAVALTKSDLKPHSHAAKPNPLSEALEGIRWSLRSKSMRVGMALACLANFGLTAVFTAVILSLRAHGTDATTIGFIETVAGVAGLVGALIAPFILKHLSVGRTLVVVLSLAVVVLLPLIWFPQVWAVMVAVGIFMTVVPAANAGIMAWITAITPDRLMGRVQTALSLVAGGLMPVATMLAGIMLEHVSRAASLLVGIVALAVAVSIGMVSKAVREIGKADELRAVD